ncbi:8-oxo-dGTP diphosphatase [Pedobacter cryoconitis]|uniref:8-oxo-dGTP diphosphatase n=1 Tax=Pedobacter cryoconitis TaxID=188932 RepID=A0A7W8YTU3_9SPHI|nr:NUDIX domain-containing protein [Pedobacter cryoconitis]MBB5621572.1 8-oxo-dGTP diphosphatase [Pedobacter cryoconitis]MBB5643908.1 8-oxo-dGTP diphosphatase [Pedobacter cryoconitis]
MNKVTPKIDQDIKVTVDAIVFGYNQENGISVLLIKRKIEPFLNEWALPGGFVLNHETLEEAVERELLEEAGVSINYLEQLFTFGKPSRDPRMRIISVAYFGLVKSSDFSLFASTDASEAAWFNIYDLPPLAFDHKEVVEKAIARLRAKITYEPIGFELLDPKFLFSNLEQLYMELLGHDIDRRNFKRKVMSLGLVIELDEKAPALSAGRPGKLYSFDKEKYKQLKVNGFDLNKLL